MTLMENAEALFDAPPPAEQERMVEAILFASAEPLSLAQIGERLPHGSDAGAALERELLELCKYGLATYKYPRWFNFIGELPKTATGKIQRFKLRAG